MVTVSTTLLSVAMVDRSDSSSFMTADSPKVFLVLQMHTRYTFDILSHSRTAILFCVVVETRISPSSTFKDPCKATASS